MLLMLQSIHGLDSILHSHVGPEMYKVALASFKAFVYT